MPVLVLVEVLVPVDVQVPVPVLVLVEVLVPGKEVGFIDDKMLNELCSGLTYEDECELVFSGGNITGIKPK